MIECTCENYEMFKCWDCAQCTDCMGEYYMVNDDLWDAATEDTFPDIMLCIGCLENRLGGLLTKDDFTAAPINYIAEIVGSPRIQNRLTNYQITVKI